jgi:hypothetical protein
VAVVSDLGGIAGLRFRSNASPVSGTCTRAPALRLRSAPRSGYGAFLDDLRYALRAMRLSRRPRPSNPPWAGARTSLSGPGSGLARDAVCAEGRSGSPDRQRSVNRECPSTARPTCCGSLRTWFIPVCPSRERCLGVRRAMRRAAAFPWRARDAPRRNRLRAACRYAA